MAKAPTKLSAQDRVILFCAAIGIDHAAVGILARDMQSMASGDSSRTIARVGPLHSQTADTRRSPRSFMMSDLDRSALGVRNADLHFKFKNLGLPTPKWLATNAFQVPFKYWREQLKLRRDVFLGYCSSSAAVAHKIKEFLAHELKLSILDWATDVDPATTILHQVEEASRRCGAGIFLFTKDDALSDEDAGGRDHVPLVRPLAPGKVHARDIGASLGSPFSPL